MLHQVGFVVEVHGVFRVFIEEAEVADGSFKSQPSEADTVHSTASFRDGRKLASDGANVLGGTVEVATIVDGSAFSNSPSSCSKSSLGSSVGGNSHAKVLEEVNSLGLSCSKSSSGIGTIAHSVPRGTLRISNGDGHFIGNNGTSSVNALIIDVAVIKQRNVVVAFNGLAKMLRHRHGIS